MKTEIKTSTKYDDFKIRRTNRAVPEVRILAMVESIKKIDLTPHHPIVVNEKFEIIDGQTRYFACRRLKKPIYFTMADLGNKSDPAIIELNSHMNAWNLKDYVEFYAKKGNPEYQKVLDCMDEYKHGVSNALAIVANGKPDSVAIRAGKYKAGKRPYPAICNDLKQFKTICNFSNHNRFVLAFVSLCRAGKYSHQSDFQKFQTNRKDMMKCASTQQYLMMFQDIMNWRRRGEKVDFKALVA